MRRPANLTLSTVISLASVMSLDVTVTGPTPADDTQSGASGRVMPSVPP